MIYDNLVYLGSEQATRYAAINERKIEHIVSIGCEPIINLNDQINMHIAHDYFQVEDTGEKSNVDYFFSEVLPQIHLIIEDCVSKNVAVLIHCQAGISRSATAVITWLMEKKGMTYENAFEYVKARRGIIKPNRGFVERMNAPNL